MSSVQDQIKCPQCEYLQADYVYYCGIGEDETTCRRCGYHESWTAKRNPEDIPCGWVHEIDRGLGAMFYSPMGREIFTSVCLRSPEELAEAERWLREEIAKRVVDPEKSYLTRWNSETNSIEIVAGTFYDWPEFA
jgi:hypothetical protein